MNARVGLLAASFVAALPAAAQDRAQRLGERARQDREIVYFLQPPETHAFDLYHDLTESREGADRYLNVVRAGSTVSNPKAVALDTGEALLVETLKGDAIAKAGIEIGEPVRPESEVVVIRFPKVGPGRDPAAADLGDLHRPRALPARRRRARLRPHVRTAAQRRGAARRLLPDQLVDPGHVSARPRTAASASTSRTRGPTRSRC